MMFMGNLIFSSVYIISKSKTKNTTTSFFKETSERRKIIWMDQVIYSYVMASN